MKNVPRSASMVLPHLTTWLREGLSVCMIAALALCASSVSRAATVDHSAEAAPAASKAPAKSASAAATTTETQTLGTDLKKALKDNLIDKKNLKLVITDKPPFKPAGSAADGHGTAAAAPAAMDHAPAPAAKKAPAHTPAVVNPRASRDYIKAKAAALTGHEAGTDAHGGEVHWSYEGETGPQAWGKLKPEFNVCAIGKRQSPINIEDSGTLHGPAEPLMFNYTPSNGVVVNNGHTIQVDVQGENTLRVRGTVYKLLQFHFHAPSEEQINYRNAAMVAHLVHKSSDGQLAVVAVLLDPGAANALINKVWTYMPLDANDRVRLPLDILDMNELLPKDQRYFQFMGSLTTPPCTEGVLWMVLKQSSQISKDQIRLFQQLYPNNARPVQPVNGRPVRNAQ
ncbi:MAG: carbonic anhydrase family protein [Comamonadaceae bacterium]|nr:carbonic anhydrase family protein [Comamonadaceae bacterium]